MLMRRRNREHYEILTDRMIREYRREASAAGDPDMVHICSAALDGDHDALEHVVEGINAWRACEPREVYTWVTADDEQVTR
jgi:hypothetical protein